MNDHSELKTAAEACKDLLPLRYMHSPGGSLSIRNDHGIVFGVHQNRSFPSMMEANKAHADLVLAATPAAVLALIAENDRLKSDNREMLEFKRHMVELRETHGFESWAAALVEVDKLRAENEAMRKALTTIRDESSDLGACECAADALADSRKKLTTVHFVCDQIPGPDGCRFIELENPQGESLGDESGKWEIRPDGLAQLVVEIASPDVKRMAALLECAQGDLKQAMQIIEKESKPLDDLIAENEVLCSKIASINASGFGDAFYQVAERLGVTGSRPVSPMQVFTSEVLPTLDKAIKDAERYRWLRDKAQPADWEFIGHQDPDVVDKEIDAAMAKEVSP